MGHAYHGAVRVGPDLVPVGRDGRASRDGSGQLKSTRGTVVVASNLGVSGIGDGVAIAK